VGIKLQFQFCAELMRENGLRLRPGENKPAG
jgi:hypothetical protein